MDFTSPPRLIFEAWQHTSQWLPAALAVSLALGLIGWLARHERRLVPAGTAWLLTGLRILVLGLGLTLLWRPVLTWQQQQTKTGRVLVGVDVSDSMSSRDLCATDAERLRWARAVGLVARAGPGSRWHRWQQAVDQGMPPEWVTPDEFSTPAEREQVAQARQQNYQALLAQVGELSRRDLASRLVAGEWLGTLSQRAEIETYLFAGETALVDRAQLPAAISEPAASLQISHTELVPALQMSGQSTLKPRGIVLLTDGRDHGLADVVESARALAAVDCPVFPVIVGTVHSPRDISITGIDAPAAVYEGDTPRVKVLVSQYGLSTDPVKLDVVRWTLGEGPFDESAPSETVETREIVLDPGTTTIELALPKAAQGRYRYQVRLAEDPLEIRVDNNRRSFTFNVVDDRARVLLVEQQARWEFRHLQAALERDPRIVLTTTLFEQPVIGALDEPFFPRTLPDLTEPIWKDADLLIVGDVSPESLNSEYWTAIEEFVSDRGGTLVLLAGKQNLPQRHVGTALDKLLPVTEPVPLVSQSRPEAPPQLRGLPLALSVEGRALPMLQLAETEEANQQIWSTLPGPAWVQLGQPKPGASVWLTTQLPAAAGLEAERSRAIMVHQHYGLGQVVWVGMDSTWRWRMRAGDRWHHRFWGQLARWSAQAKSDAGNAQVRFGLEHSAVRTGEDVLVRARWTPSFQAQHPVGGARAEFYRVDSRDPRPVATIDLQANPDRPLLAEGRTSTLPAGEYLVRLQMEEGALNEDRAEPIEARLSVTDRVSIESADVSANLELLQAIATASGGRLVQPDELDQLPGWLNLEVEQQMESQAVPLWDHWLGLAMIALLLTIEWAVRKRAGLP